MRIQQSLISFGVFSTKYTLHSQSQKEFGSFSFLWESSVSRDGNSWNFLFGPHPEKISPGAPNQHYIPSLIMNLAVSHVFGSLQARDGFHEISLFGAPSGKDKPWSTKQTLHSSSYEEDGGFPRLWESSVQYERVSVKFLVWGSIQKKISPAAPSRHYTPSFMRSTVICSCLWESSVQQERDFIKFLVWGPIQKKISPGAPNEQNILSFMRKMVVSHSLGSFQLSRSDRHRFRPSGLLVMKPALFLEGLSGKHQGFTHIGL